MADILNLVARALVIFGVLLDRLSPFGIPWPLPLSALFPILAAVLGGTVWWSRGMVWPVRCEYPDTTTGHPCRNRILGEWHRCHHHRPGRYQRTKRRQVVKLDRWQTLSRGGKVAERSDIHGRGWLRRRSHYRGLLYYRGFARPLDNVLAFAPTWRQERRDDWAKLRAQLREGRLNLRALLTGAAGASARVGVSERLPQVIQAARLVLLLVALGLVLVGVAVWQQLSTKHAINYLATLLFIAAWAVARWGIWPQATANPEPRRRRGWVAMAAAQTWGWFGQFMLVSVVAGGLIDLAARTIRIDP